MPCSKNSDDYNLIFGPLAEGCNVTVVGQDDRDDNDMQMAVKTLLSLCNRASMNSCYNVPCVNFGPMLNMT